MESQSMTSTMLDAQAAVRRAEECLESESPLRAADVLEELKGRFPQEARIWHLGGRVAEGLGNAEVAEAHYRKALSLAPGCCDCGLDLAELLLDGGRGAEGAALIESLAQRYPEDARAQGLLGRARDEQGRIAEAEVAFRRALDIEPAFEWASRRLSSILCRRGELEEAERVLRETLERSPEDALTLACLGCVARRRGDDGEAERCFRGALRIDFGTTSAFCGLFDLLVRTDREAEAHDLLEEALSRLPDDDG